MDLKTISKEAVSPTPQTQRIEALDIAKGIAIYLVVWMHCIQYIGNTSFDNHLYCFVYSFHMPLFLLISGYLFYKSLGKNIYTTIKKRALRLLLPNLLWGGYLAAILQSFSPSFILTAFWFLYTLFVCSLLYLIVSRITNVWLSVILLSIASLLLPGLEFIKFSLPFFGIGLIMAKYDILNRLSKSKTFVIGLVVASIISYLLVWNKSWYIYTTPNPNLLHFEANKWYAYGGRILQGTLMSTAIITLLIALTNYWDKSNSLIGFRRISRNLSDNSLGIYAIHLFILMIVSGFAETIVSEFSHNQLIITILSLIIAIIMVVAFVPLLDRMKRNRFLKYHC